MGAVGRRCGSAFSPSENLYRVSEYRRDSRMTKFGRPLSGAIGVVAFSQVLSTTVHTIVPKWEESFATMSNLAYVISGCYHHIHTEPMSGSLCNPAFPLLVLGVGSFAFHAEPEGHANKHTLDIWAGLVVVLHLACTSLSAAMTEAFSKVLALRPYSYVADVAFMVLFVSSMLVVTVLYSQVYSNQLLFYMICASSTIVFAFTIRVRLFKRSVSSAILSFFEAIAAFGIALSAVFVQGNLAGRNVTYSTHKDLYDIFHGMWHIQLALVVSLLNIRFADVLEQTQQPIRNQKHITDAGILDISWMSVFFIQAIAMFLMKELESSVVSLQVVLWVVCFVHVLHAARLVYITYRPETAMSTRDILPLVP